MILFGIWCILIAISKLFNLVKMDNFLTQDWLVCFIFVNFIFTTVLYTIFQLSSGDFGLYSTIKPLAWRNFATSILGYYLFIATLIIFIKLDSQEQITIRNKKLGHIISSVFLCVYYLVVKLTGEFVYKIGWFPYIIFDAKSFGNTLGIQNYALSIILLTICLITLFVLYQITFLFLLRFKHNKRNKKTTPSV